MTINRRKGLVAALTITVAASFGPGLTAWADEAGKSVDIVYTGGDIITMEGDAPEYAEAVAVRNGKIAYVGPQSGVAALIGGQVHRTADRLFRGDRHQAPVYSADGGGAPGRRS